MEFENRR